MDQFIALYSQYYYALGIILALVLVALIVEVALMHSRLSKVKRTYDRLFGDAQGRNLEKLLKDHMDRVEGNARDIEGLTRDVRRLANAVRGAVQHVGFVRFNPFPDTGSDQSFSIALLDDLDNGVVITSLHNRTATRVYAKPIQRGQALYPLSNEEKEAVDGARRRIETGATRVEGRGSRVEGEEGERGLKVKR